MAKKKKTYRSSLSKWYYVAIGDRPPHQVKRADLERYQLLGLVTAPRAVYTDTAVKYISRLCEGVIAWIDCGRIALQNLRTRVTEWIKTASNWPCPFFVSEETIYYWHCLTAHDRELWDAQRALVMR